MLLIFISIAAIRTTPEWIDWRERFTKWSGRCTTLTSRNYYISVRNPVGLTSISIAIIRCLRSGSLAQYVSRVVPESFISEIIEENISDSEQCSDVYQNGRLRLARRTCIQFENFVLLQTTSDRKFQMCDYCCREKNARSLRRRFAICMTTINCWIVVLYLNLILLS